MTKGCVHPYYALTHGGQCMGCRKSPPPKNLPDHYAYKPRDQVKRRVPKNYGATLMRPLE